MVSFPANKYSKGIACRAQEFHQKFRTTISRRRALLLLRDWERGGSCRNTGIGVMREINLLLYPNYHRLPNSRPYYYWVRCYFSSTINCQLCVASLKVGFGLATVKVFFLQNLYLNQPLDYGIS